MSEATTPIIVYGRPACPMVPPVLRALDSAGVPYEYVDIRQDMEARERVRTINNGNESVPTLVFPDGSTLTEPGLKALEKKLTEAGHDDTGLDSAAARVGYTLSNPATLLTILAIVAILALVLASR